MLQQLSYAREDILDNRARHAVLFIQIAVALVVFGFTTSLVLNALDFRNRVFAVIHDQEIYLTRDITDPARLDREVYGAADGPERLSALYAFMKNDTAFKTYTADAQHFLWLSGDAPDSSFAVIVSESQRGHRLLQIDQGFLDVFQLECSHGTLFTGEHFTTVDSADTIPLVLGHSYRKVYSLNDVITGTAGIRFQVIGFLKPSSFYLDPGKEGRVRILDEWFITPVSDRVGNRDSAVCSTFIITDDPSQLDRIQRRSTELGLYTFEFRSFSSQLDHIRSESELQLKLIGLILGVMLMFSMIGMVSNLIQFITTHTREFAIHLLCGGRVTSIIQRITAQVLFLIVTADAIVIAIHRITPVTLITVAFSLFVAFAIVVFPAFWLSSAGINNLLRRAD